VDDTFIHRRGSWDVETELGILPEGYFSYEFIQEAVRTCFGTTIQLGRSCVDGKSCHIRIRNDENNKS